MVRGRIEWERVAGLRAVPQSVWLCVLLFVTVLVATQPSFAEEPLTGAAYTDADEAYAAFKKGDFATAIAKTREAIALRPDSVQLRLLLLDVLVANGNLEEADVAASEALSKVGNNADLIARQTNIRERIAYKGKSSAYVAADNALKAFARQDYQTAVTEAGKAVAADPTNLSYRLILINSLIAAKDLEEANKQVADAISKVGSNPELLTRQRLIAEQIAARSRNEAWAAADAAYKAFAEKDYVTAAAQARKAIQLDPDTKSYRVLLANIERAANAPPAQAQSRGEVFAQRGYDKQRKGDYAGAMADFAAALRAGLPTQALTRNVRLSMADAALGAKEPQRAIDALASFGDVASYDVAARRGYAYLALGDRESALAAFAIALQSARSAQDRGSMAAAEIGILVDLGRKAEARELFNQALNEGDLRTQNDAQIAYLAASVGDDVTAYEYFRQASAKGLLKNKSLADVGYVAKRLSKNEEAAVFFSAAISANADGKLPLEAPYLYGLRREVSELDRQWGAYIFANYGTAGTILAPSPLTNKTGYGGGELYWRPPVIGNRNGSTFEVFGRIIDTFYDASGGPTGGPTTEAVGGARWKPFSSFGLVLAAERLFGLGSATHDDWIFIAAYSDGRGQDLRVDVPNWSYWQIYAEADRFVQVPETLAQTELRLGESYRLDAISSRLVMTPFISAAYNYDNLQAQKSAVGAGGGLNFRYWFREDTFHAPQSYLDLTAQYRWKIGGDMRAQGPFASILISY